MFDMNPAAPGITLLGLTDELRDIACGVAALRRPCDPMFAGLTTTLSSTAETLGSINADFRALCGHLESEIASRSAQAVNQAITESAALTEGSAAILRQLQQTLAIVDTCSRPLSALTGIIGEVGALGVNAKVQTSQMSAAGVDFSVFTSEIDRLHGQADQATRQMSAHFRQVREYLSIALNAERQFVASEGQAIEALRRELQSSIDAMTDRRALASGAMTAVGARCAAISDRLNRSITAMQINDRTAQRLEHVQSALALLASTVTAEAAQDTAPAPSALPDQSRTGAMVAAGCHLQARQLALAVDQFATEVGHLKGEIAGLAQEVAAVMAETAAAFDSDDHGSSFVHRLAEEATRGVATFSRYMESHQTVQAMVGRAVAGLSTLSADMSVVHDIDTDLRLMGLNASLKCARLGQRGRALGVVAQELRSCSLRTEETSQSVALSVAQASEAAESLQRHIDDGRAETALLARSMAETEHSLAALGTRIDTLLATMVAAWKDVSAMLQRAAADTRAHDEMRAQAAQLVERLGLLAERSCDDPALEDEVQSDLHAMLDGRYTMADERDAASPDESDDITLF